MTLQEPAPNRKRPSLFIAMLVMSVLLLLAGCAQPSAPSPPQQQTAAGASQPETATPATPLETAVSIATHATGSSYNSTAAGMAKVISEHTAIKVSLKPYSGPQAWMPVMEKSGVELGILSGPDLGWAFSGTTTFDHPVKNIRLLVKGDMGITIGVVVRQDSDIQSLKDLKGKRVATQYGGNAVAQLAMDAYLASAGLSSSDITPVPVPEFSSGFKLLRENKVDATFGASPTSAASVETHAAIGVRALSFADADPARVQEIPATTLKALTDRIPGAVPMVGKQGTGYLEQDTIGHTYPLTLAASADLSEEGAYQITKALWDHYQELHPLYTWLQGFTPETMFTTDPPAPYHPGAVRFFKERGIWTEEAEQNQRALLAKAE